MRRYRCNLVPQGQGQVQTTLLLHLWYHKHEEDITLGGSDYDWVVAILIVDVNAAISRCNLVAAVDKIDLIPSTLFSDHQLNQCLDSGVATCMLSSITVSNCPVSSAFERSAADG